MSYPLVEFRRYALVPGRRDRFVELFERAFVEPQEALGMRLVAMFRDLDQPDRFVWVRQFPDVERRPGQLEAFYTGPVWKAHREAANADIVDSDNVFLYRPYAPCAGFPPDRTPRPPLGAAGVAVPSTVVEAVRVPLADTAAALALAERFEREIRPVFGASGVEVLSTLVTDTAPNGFPRLPAREHEPSFAWFARFPDAPSHARWRASPGAAWSAAVKDAVGEVEVMRLQPTARSALR